MSYCVTPTRRRICKPLIRKNYTSFARYCVKNQRTKKALIKTLGRELNIEISFLCSDKSSILYKFSKQSLMNFKFTAVTKELERKTPILYSLLRSCTKTPKPRSNADQVLVLLAGIICKNRKPQFCQVQRMISMILYAGHASKQVGAPLLLVHMLSS